VGIAKTYITYEKQLYVGIINKTRKEGPQVSKNPFQERKKEGNPREGKGPVRHFVEYTPLAVSREKILAEIRD
jgi:hypothetical protein